MDIMEMGGFSKNEDGSYRRGPRFDIKVKLVGTDGNAFALMGRVTSALRRAGATKAETDEFYAEATSGDYDHLLQTCMAWVDVS